ncbi:hypothetical protein RvY_12169 [Ramazzottius varieornatus]|uniref:Cystatin domain-containing protein n=1 Tax=Ramazzottius varieornatus TaxID=947166 RepID=A0A1D1VIN7_RAMVA|nr:hypothetical protein RvY_12169 [Ramazzottius varieornatus]
MASKLIIVLALFCFPVGTISLKSAPKPGDKTIDDVLHLPVIFEQLIRDCGLHFGGIKATSYQIETSDRGITYFAKVEVNFPRDKAVLLKEMVVSVPTNPRAVATIKKNPCIDAPSSN